MRGTIVLTGILLACAAGLAAAPGAAAADIHVDIQIGGPPQLVVIPGTPVYHAPALPYNYFSYGGQYYLFHEGSWFFAATYSGPWAPLAVEYVPRPILAVPVEYYRKPPEHWKKGGPPPWAPAWGHRGKEKEKERGKGKRKHRGDEDDD